MEITISLEGLTSQSVYRYVSLCMLGLAYIPQIRLSIANKTPMNDVSSVTLGMLTVSGLLWSLYTYEQGEIYSAIGTIFMTINIVVLDVCKIYFYIQSVRKHYKTFGEPTEADPTKVAVAEIISAAINKDKIQDLAV